MMHIAGGVVLGLFIWHIVLPVMLVLLAHMFRERPPKPPKAIVDKLLCKEIRDAERARRAAMTVYRKTQ